MTINLKHSKEILANKISLQVREAYDSIGRRTDPDQMLSKEITIELLKNLGYLTTGFDGAEQAKFSELWSILASVE